MSFFGKTSKVDTKHKNPDDGLQSFGVFSYMLDNVDLTKPTARSSAKRRPAQTKTPKIKSMIARLAAKDNARKGKTNRTVEMPRHVTPIPKGSRANVDTAGEKYPPREPRKRTTNTATKAAGTKKQKKSCSTADISSFFAFKSTKVNGGAEAQVQSQKKGQDHIPKFDSSIASIQDLNAGPSILSHVPPMTTITTETSVPDAETRDENISRLSSMVSPSEEITLTDEKQVDAEQILSQRKEEKRRKENKRVFGRRIASSHLLAQLERRCTHNTRCDRNMDAGYHGMRGNVLQRWHRISNVHLEMGTNNAEITCMAFDSEGVLLAIADNSGYIRIFDFDEVNAADIATRQEHKKGTSLQKKTIAPFIIFRIGTDRISSLTWNPFNENIVAVTFFNKREVRMFDVSTSSNNGPSYSSLIDSNTRSTCSSSLKYVSANRILVGGDDGTLSLWKCTPPSRDAHNATQNRTIWSIKPWDAKSGLSGGITNIIHLPSSPSKEKCGLLVAATSIGYFALIDMSCCSRKSFSSCMTPKILHTWNISHLGALRKHILPSSKWMGVEKMYVLADKPTLRDCKFIMDKAVELAVITSGGWVIALKFDMTKNKVGAITASVVHRSPTVIQCDSTQTSFYDGPNLPASVPEFASVHGKFDKATSLMVVTKTKPMYQVLPDYDKRVLGQSIGNGGLISSMNKTDGPDGLAVIHRNAGKIFDIPIKGKLKHLVIHPDNEWIVASTISSSGQLYLQLMRLKSNAQTKGITKNAMSR